MEMVEEVKQSRVHFDLAKRIVDLIANGDEYLSQEVAVEVLKPFLVENITLVKQKQHSIPERWFNGKVTDKNE